MPLSRLEECKIAPGVPLREVRLAVSMVGGTSLAIYENGATQELFRLVHGKGAYGLMKRLTRSHVYADVLSGTSAGGINTIFLSTALTNGTDLWHTRDAWVGIADIDRLIPDADERPLRSLLKGNSYYREALLGVFHKLTGDREIVQCSPLRSGFDTDHRYGEIDLFVTGTYLEGMPSVFFDSRNQPLFSETHNGVFRLKHRPQRGKTGESHFNPTYKDPLGLEDQRPRAASVPPPGGNWPAKDPLSSHRDERREAICQRLSIIARTTSSLPAIFEPAAVPHHLMKGIIPLPHDRQPDSKTRTITTYFGDGGYLNNRPINLVLERVKSRHSGPEVLRKLVFVEPVAEGLTRQSAIQEEPSALAHLAFYAGVQGKQSLRDHLQSIEDHNRRVRRVKEALKCARYQASSHQTNSDHRHEGGGDPSRTLWVELRLQELRDQIITRWEAYVTEHSRPDYTGDGQQVRKDLEKAQKRAERLRQLREYLRQHLEAHCADLPSNRGGNEGDEAVKSGTFHLETSDAEFLGRKILLLKDDARDTLYPQVESPSDETELSRVSDWIGLRSANLEQYYRQAVLEAIAEAEKAETPEQRGAMIAASAAEASGYLTQLSWLNSVVELVRTLQEEIVDAVALTPQFISAVMKVDSTDSFDPGSAAQQLWELLAGAIAMLLSPLSHLDPENPDAFTTPLRRRSRQLCDAIVGSGSLPQAEQRPEGSPLVLKAIEAQVEAVALRLAGKLKPAIVRWRDLPFHWAYDDDNNPLEWAEMRRRLEGLDLHLYPVERAAELPSLNPIELVHISARNVQVGLSRESAANKLAGDVMMNLGGFFKRSWRVNDVLWGRLDASGALTEALIDTGRIGRVIEDALRNGAAPEFIAAIRGYLISGSSTAVQGEATSADSVWECLCKYPPHGVDSVENDLKAIEGWLHGDRSDATLTLEAVVRWLTVVILHRHQLEILLEEVPEALAADLSEHGQWQGAGLTGKFERALQAAVPPPARLPQGPASDGTQPHFKFMRMVADRIAIIAGPQPGSTTRSSLDSLALQWVKQRFGKVGANPALEERIRDLDAVHVFEHFDRDYQVGAESIEKDVPPLVNIRRAAQGFLVALVVLRDSLQSAQGVPLFNRLVQPLELLARAFSGFINLTSQGRAPAAATHAVAWSLIIGAAALSLATPLPDPAKRLLATIGAIALVLEVGYWTLVRGRLHVFAFTLIALALGSVAYVLMTKMGPGLVRELNVSQSLTLAAVFAQWPVWSGVGVIGIALYVLAEKKRKRR